MNLSGNLELLHNRSVLQAQMRDLAYFIEVMEKCTCTRLLTRKIWLSLCFSLC